MVARSTLARMWSSTTSEKQLRPAPPLDRGDAFGFGRKRETAGVGEDARVCSFHPSPRHRPCSHVGLEESASTAISSALFGALEEEPVRSGHQDPTQVVPGLGLPAAVGRLAAGCAWGPELRGEWVGRGSTSPESPPPTLAPDTLRITPLEAWATMVATSASFELNGELPADRLRRVVPRREPSRCRSDPARPAPARRTPRRRRGARLTTATRATSARCPTCCGGVRISPCWAAG